MTPRNIKRFIILCTRRRVAWHISAARVRRCLAIAIYLSLPPLPNQTRLPNRSARRNSAKPQVVQQPDHE